MSDPTTLPVDRKGSATPPVEQPPGEGADPQGPPPLPECIACGKRILWRTLWGNFGLGLYKAALGFFGGSSALVADGIHSLTDVIGTGVLIASRRIAEKPPDNDYPYGYGKVEFVASAFIYLVLLILAVLIFLSGLTMIIAWNLHKPSFTTLLGALVSVLANGIMYQAGQCAGNRTNSPALLANSFENRADALSSGAAGVGIVLAMFVHPIFDPLAAMIVGILIFGHCIEELSKALSDLMDRGLPPEELSELKELVTAREGVADITFVKSRKVGSSYWIDLGLSLDEKLDVVAADGVARSLRTELMRRWEHLETVEIFIASASANKASVADGAHDSRAEV